MNNCKIVDKVKEAIGPILKRQAIELVKITHRREGRREVLRLLVDKSNGITLDECAVLNHLVSQILDELDIFKGSYLLEVFSPGLDRNLVSLQDFERIIGQLISVTMKSPIEGKSRWVGRIERTEEQAIFIKTENGLDLKLPLKEIAKAKREIRFS